MKRHPFLDSLPFGDFLKGRQHRAVSNHIESKLAIPHMWRDRFEEHVSALAGHHTANEAGSEG
jgi:hypothetical protein